MNFIKIQYQFIKLCKLYLFIFVIGILTNICTLSNSMFGFKKLKCN